MYVCGGGAVDGVTGRGRPFRVGLVVWRLPWDFGCRVGLECAVGGCGASGESLSREFGCGVVAYFYAWGVLRVIRSTC
jgi:hypothetical protein